MVPYYLKNHLINIKEKKNKTKAMLISSTGNTNLEIYFYGELINFKRIPFIIDSEYPCLIVAKDSLTSEEFIVFDGAKHGYDAMFCNETIKNIERDLEKYDKYSGEIEITLGYSIDYEEEKEEYEFVKNNQVKLMYGVMNWEEAKSIGFDWINLKFKKGRKTFLDLELA